MEAANAAKLEYEEVKRQREEEERKIKQAEEFDRL